MKPWVEKYRPQSLNDIVSQNTTIEYLKKFIKKKRFQHLIFTGPAGTGKTSAAWSFIHDVYSMYFPNLTPSAEWVFERNASDELRKSKGDVDDLKEFVNQDSVNLNIGHKFVLLEESDRMSNDVQGALRRIMEQAPINVTFIFTNNYVENLIDPIISRCGVFRFYPIPKSECIALVKSIIKKEKSYFSDEEINIVYKFSRGDLRKLLNSLQIISKVSKEARIDLYEFFGIYSLDILSRLIDACKKMEFQKIMDISKIHINPQNVIFQLFDYAIENCTESNENITKEMILCLEDFDKRFIMRTDTKLQIKSLLSSLSLLLGGT